jgi:hypothetical protein
MNRTTPASTQTALFAEWSQYLQRRTMFLLQRYDHQLFRGQFRLFYSQSTLPTIPLLQYYDSYLRIVFHNDEFFDIIERINRQLKTQNSQIFTLEEAPTRGEPDWQRTSARSLNETPDLPPLLIETSQRQHSMDIPENLFVVAVLLNYRQAIQELLKKDRAEEILSNQERQQFVTMQENLEHLLSHPYAHELLDQAANAGLTQLAEQVHRRLPVGNSPYRELYEWWEQFQALHIGQESGRNQLTLHNKPGNQRTNTWLYELWIVLEIVNLLADQQRMTSDDLQIATDQIQIHFTWNERKFLFTYNRRSDTSENTIPGWQNIAAIPPCYSLKRETLLQKDIQEKPVWNESSVIFDVSYEIGSSLGNQNPAMALRKLLGEMRLHGASHGVIFTPLLPDPPVGVSYTHAQRDTTTYTEGMSYNLSNPNICLCKLLPNRDLQTLHERLQVLLNDLTSQETLPERPEPACHGILLDEGTVNASGSLLLSYNVLCPKPHIGEGVFDLVNDKLHCLKDPLVCHIYGQAKLAPFVVRAATKEEMIQQSSNMRAKADALLKEAEENDDDAKAEILRKQIFQGVGQTVEQFVRVSGKALIPTLEKQFDEWIFGIYWKKDPRCLTEETRHILLSGEYVWQEYQDADLQDWAAPAIQFCRALETEIKRRLHDHYPNPRSGFDLSKSGGHMTLGAVTAIYSKRNQLHGTQDSWNLFMNLVRRSSCDSNAFITVMEDIKQDEVAKKRNSLAHGGAISHTVAQQLRDSIIGSKSKTGILCWIAENLEPKQ